MAINQNHLFEDLEGVKCAIVEKNAGEERVSFLKTLLEHNGYKVVVVASPPPKAPAATPPVTTETGEVPPPPPAAPPPPSTFTIGVTDVTFNPTNAIFGRLLRTKDGKVVTLGYWNQTEKVSDETKPYFSN